MDLHPLHPAKKKKKKTMDSPPKTTYAIKPVPPANKPIRLIIDPTLGKIDTAAKSFINVP